MTRFSRLLAVVAFLGSTALANAAALLPYEPGPRLIDGTKLNLMVSAVNNLTGNGTAAAITGTTGTFSGVVSAGNGTVSLPGFTFGSDTDTGLYRIGANNLGVAASGAKVLDVGTAGLGVTGTLTGTSASASAFAVGRLGATTPAFLVDASTASSVTGLQVKSAAAAAGLAVSVVSSGTDENLTIDAKGAGTITLNATGTGNIVMGRAVTGVSSSVTGALTARSGTATPAAASAVPALSWGSAGLGLYWGTGAPSISAIKGSIYIQTDGSSTSTRLFINNGTTNWVAITTAS